MPRATARVDAEPATDPDTNASSYSGIGRALRIINAVVEASSTGIGVSALARDLSLPKAVTHRILKALTTDGFLAFDEQTKMYSLGVGALKIGLAAVRLLDVPAAAKPVLHRLVEMTGETATLSIRDGWTRMYLDQVLSPKEVRMSVSVGHSYPLHAGSSSKAILAALPDLEIEEYLHTGKRDRLTAATIVDPVALRNEIATIRRLGYATSRGERQADAGSVASAVYQADGRVFGSLSVCGPAFRFDAATQRRIGAIVRDVGDELSKTVGYHA
jgi:DNA-binding IclR family transcriptional regulator